MLLVITVILVVAKTNSLMHKFIVLFIYHVLNKVATSSPAGSSKQILIKFTKFIIWIDNFKVY